MTIFRDTRARSYAQGLSRGVGIAVAVIGSLVLAGWALGLTALKSVSPGLLTMKPNTAVCFVLAGISLWLQTSPGAGPRSQRAIGRVFAAVVVLIGALTLGESVGNCSLGIDCLMFQDARSAVETSPPGRMCPTSALVLVFLGAALLRLDSGKRAASQILALLAALLVSIPLLGYVFGAPSLYSFAPYTTVALHTAGTALLLSVGVLGARPDRGIMAYLTGDSAGCRGARRLLPAALLVPVLLGRLALSGSRWGNFGMATTTAISAALSIVVLAALIWWNAGHSHRAEEAQHRSDERLRMATEAAGMGLWFWDVITDRIEWTPTCRELFGVPPDREMSSRALQDVVHPEDRERFRRAAHDALADEAEYAIEYRVIRPDGAVCWLAARGRPFHEAGRPRSMMGVAVDITARKQIERVREALLDSERAARATVEKIGRMKDEFLTTLSHELRTPLTAILGWAHIARTRRDERAIPECLVIIERNARLQERLVDDLLDMNRIVSGKLRLEIRPMDLVAITEATLDTVRPAMDAKGIQVALQVELPPGGSFMVGDPDRLQQVVRNLLTNAVKFTPRGGRVDVVVQRCDGALELRVSDTGQGIPADFLPCLFDRFRQADGSMTRKHGGLGLGLAIVRDLVELHGGNVDAESAGVGQGAMFTVRLPMANAGWGPDLGSDGRAGSPPAPAHPEVSAILQLDRECLKDIKVLVVDDDETTCDMVQRILGEHAARVTTASTPLQALAEFQRDTPDVLVSDIGMPDIDGFELLRQIRALEDGITRMVPAIALTAFVRPEDQARALSAGYQVFLPKPIECSKLVRSIATLASRR